MKHYMLLTFALCTSLIVKAQDTIVSIAYTSTAWRYFYFEEDSDANYFLIDSSQLNNIWQIGAPLKTVFDSAHSIPNALVTDTILPYLINNTSSFSFTIWSDDATTIEFWHRLDTDNGKDGGVIEVSYDGGSNWMNVIDDPELFTFNYFYSQTDTVESSNKVGFSGFTSEWKNSTIHGSAFNYLKFRFTFYSDSTFDNKDGWIIDGITVNCQGTGIESMVDENLKIYPNPSSDIVFFKTNIDFANNIVIKNLLGQIVKTVDNKKVDVSELTNGVYVVECNSPKKKIVKKLIKN